SGSGMSLSNDGKWVIAIPSTTPPQQLVALPTGPGESRTLTHDAINHIAALWLPDSRRFAFAGSEPGRGMRLWVQDADGGAPRPISPEGIEVFAMPVSPDGTRVAAVGHDRESRLYATNGSGSRPIPGTGPSEIPVRFSNDGRSLYARTRSIPVQVTRIDLASGRRELWKQFMPSDEAGVVGMV